MNEVIRNEFAASMLGVEGRMLNVIGDPETGVIRNQRFSASRPMWYDGKPATIRVSIRFDDECLNNHSSFSITGEIWLDRRHSDCEMGGCIHEEIAKYFPELAPLIKWHLCATDGPMHYIANTTYHAKDRNLGYARSSAIWPEATDAQLCLPKAELTALLEARLPALIARFRIDMEACGFLWDLATRVELKTVTA